MRFNRWRNWIACGSALAPFLISPLTAQPPVPSVQGGGAVCPLSEERTQKAIQAFDQLAAVFTKEPRCVNCHGGVNPFAPDGDGHVGGAIAVIRKSGDQIDLNATNAQCQLCHSGLPGWKLAPANDVFQGQTAVQICKNQKFVFGRLLTTGPAGFANHIETDVGSVDFIGNAFFGDRGLNLSAIGLYEAITGKKFQPEPITTVTHPQLNALARQWADALGSKFQGDDECGCVPHRYALKIEEDFKFNGAALGLRVSLAMNNELQVPLTFKDNGSFDGTGTYTRIVNVIANDPRSGCTGRVAPQTVTWKVKGSLVGSDLDHPGVMQFKLEVTDRAETLTITNCRDGRNTPPLPIPSQTGAPALPDMPAVVGKSQSKDLSIPDIGLSSKMTVTIIQTK